MSDNERYKLWKEFIKRGLADDLYIGETITDEMLENFRDGLTEEELRDIDVNPKGAEE